MGLLDSLKGGSGKEVESLRSELASLRAKLKISDNEIVIAQQKNLTLIDKTHAFMERLKILVGTLEDVHVLQRCWDLLELALGIKKGAIFAKTRDGWVSDFAVGFKGDPPVIPLNEDSVPGYVAEHGVIMSLAYLKKQDDLAYLERRGVIPDAKIVCPVRINNRVEKLIVICAYSGNVFSGEDDLDTVQMAGTLLGLVLNNARVVAEQKVEIDQQRRDFLRMKSLFSSMVAPEVIDLLEKNPGGIVLGGEVRRVAVLFADIRSFTELASDISPEKTIELLNQFFTLVTDIVISSQGTLDKFMGDAAMALYGTPICLLNPSLSAVNAAIEIQKQLSIHMPHWVKQGFPEFGVGIGVNYQDVIVGNVGSERLSNFTAIGDGVNVASRLCMAAGPGEILLSKTCFEELGEWTGKVEERPGVFIKGKAEAITVYSIAAPQSHKEVCPKCADPLPATARFCGNCGYRRD